MTNYQYMGHQSRRCLVICETDTINTYTSLDDDVDRDVNPRRSENQESLGLFQLGSDRRKEVQAKIIVSHLVKV